MIRFYFFSLFAFLYSSGGTILTIENRDYSAQDFFSRYPKKQWERADSLQKEKMIDSFIRRELCVLEARLLGFQNSPDISVKIYNRKLQVLVNESYEHFVAEPLIKPEDMDLARMNAKKEVFELGRKRPYTWDDFFFTTIETVLVQLKAHIDNAKFSYDFYPNPNLTPLKRQQSACRYCGYRLVCRYSKRF